MIARVQKKVKKMGLRVPNADPKKPASYYKWEKGKWKKSTPGDVRDMLSGAAK